jgi:hypothetical protein
MAMLHVVPVLVGAARNQQAGVQMHCLRVTAHTGWELLLEEVRKVGMTCEEVLEEDPSVEAAVSLLRLVRRDLGVGQE